MKRCITGALLTIFIMATVLIPGGAHVAIDPLSLMLGGVAGYVLKDGKAQPQPVNWTQVLEQIRRDKPVTIDLVSLDASEARDNVEFTKAGDFIQIVSYQGSADFQIRLNEQDAPLQSLSKLKSINAYFYRFFITNPIGNSAVVLKVCRGIRLETADAVSNTELANRINWGVPQFDSNGQVIWADDFEDNANKWEAIGTFALSTDLAFHGSKSGKLSTAAGGLAAQISLVLPYIALSPFGWEMAFVYNTSDASEINFIIDVYDGTKYIRGEVDYLPGSTTLRYLNSDGSYTSLLTNLDLAHSGFNVMKLVIDPIKQQYVRVIINQTSHDLTGKALYSENSSDTPKLQPRFNVVIGIALTIAAYVDNCVVTQNEP